MLMICYAVCMCMFGYWLVIRYVRKAKVNDNHMYLHNNTFFILFFLFFSVKIRFACEGIDSINYVVFSSSFYLYLKNFPSHCRIQLHRANNKKQTKRKTRDVMLLRPDRKLDCSQFLFDPEREFRFFCAILFSVEAHTAYYTYLVHSTVWSLSAVSLSLASNQSCSCSCCDCCAKLTTALAILLERPREMARYTTHRRCRCCRH